jgi:single-strand DNA-binding protein
MSYELIGKLHHKGQEQQVTDRFKKREFILLDESKPTFPQAITMQLTQDRCRELDQFSEGETVKVKFSLRGKEFTDKNGEKKAFTSLEVWSMLTVNDPQQGTGSTTRPETFAQVTPPSSEDDLPF